MACDTAAILTQARCLQCTLTGDLFAAAEIALLCALRDGTGIACDSATLVSQALCIRACIPRGMMPAVKVSLLCRIVKGT